MEKEEEVMELIRVYTPLAMRIAGGFKRKLPAHILIEDIRSYAMEGLWDAARRRPEAEYFERYARIKISCAIKDGLRTADWLPRHFRSKNPGAAVIGITDNQERTLAAWHNVESQVMARMELQRVYRAVEKLSPRHRMVFMEKTMETREMQDMAEELGVTPVRVSQLYSEALAMVRQILEVEAAPDMETW